MKPVNECSFDEPRFSYCTGSEDNLTKPQEITLFRLYLTITRQSKPKEFTRNLLSLQLGTRGSTDDHYFELQPQVRRAKEECGFVIPTGTFAVHPGPMRCSSGMVALCFQVLKNDDYQLNRLKLVQDLRADALLGPSIMLIYGSPCGRYMNVFVGVDRYRSHRNNHGALVLYLKHRYPPMTFSGNAPAITLLDKRCYAHQTVLVGHDPDAYIHPDYYSPPTPFPMREVLEAARKTDRLAVWKFRNNR